MSKLQTSPARDGSVYQPKGSENVGRWTADEHSVFLRGVDAHGKAWKKIAAMIATRTVVQVRTHAQKYFQKLSTQTTDGLKGDGRRSASIAQSPRKHKTSPRETVKRPATTRSRATATAAVVTAATKTTSSASKEALPTKSERKRAKPQPEAVEAVPPVKKPKISPSIQTVTTPPEHALFPGEGSPTSVGDISLGRLPIPTSDIGYSPFKLPSTLEVGSMLDDEDISYGWLNGSILEEDMSLGSDSKDDLPSIEVEEDVTNSSFWSDEAFDSESFLSGGDMLVLSEAF